MHTQLHWRRQSHVKRIVLSHRVNNFCFIAEKMGTRASKMHLTSLDWRSQTLETGHFSLHVPIHFVLTAISVYLGIQSSCTLVCFLH